MTVEPGWDGRLLLVAALVLVLALLPCALDRLWRQRGSPSMSQLLHARPPLLVASTLLAYLLLFWLGHGSPFSWPALLAACVMVGGLALAIWCYDEPRRDMGSRRGQ